MIQSLSETEQVAALAVAEGRFTKLSELSGIAEHFTEEQLSVISRFYQIGYSAGWRDSTNRYAEQINVRIAE